MLGKRSSSKLTKLALFFLVFSIFGLARQGEAEWRLVTRVVDGDTIIVGARERVRLIGVDTPETKHPQKPVEYFGREATAFTRKMVEGKRVRIEFDEANDFGIEIVMNIRLDYRAMERGIRACLGKIREVNCGRERIASDQRTG